MPLPIFKAFLLLGLLLCALSAARSSTGSEKKTTPCSTPEYRQFDFWAGDWDAFDVDNLAVPIARARVDQTLGGCVLHEDYRENDGVRGESFSIYDASKKAWHQTWVTNRGRLLLIDGSFRNGEMVLHGTDYTAEGKPRLIRGTWKAVSEGVRETAVTSLDGGKTWNSWFDILFRPHKE